MAPSTEPLQQVDHRFIEALGRKDLDEMMTCYWHHPDLLYYSVDTRIIKGWEMVRAQWAQFLALAELKNIRLADTSYQISGDLGAMAGMLYGTMIPHGGLPVELAVRMTRVFGFLDARWVYTVDHVSIPQS